MSMGGPGTRAICTLSAAIVVAGCGSDSGVKADPVVSPSATVSVSPTPVDENAAILAAYREFFDRQTEISLAPKEQRRAMLEPFTTQPALQRVLGGMFAADEIGEVGYGVPVLEPRVTNNQRDRATVRDCQDNRMSGRKRISDGKITTRGTGRDNAEIGMRRGVDGAWRVSTVKYLDEPC